MADDDTDALISATRKQLSMEDIGGQLLKNAERTLPQASFTDVAKTAAMPTAGAVLGGIAGRRLGLPGQLVGEGAGAAAGTVGNMAAGLQTPSLWDVGAAAVSPLTGRVGGGALRGLASLGAKALPGSAAARHEIAQSSFTGIPDLIRPGTPSGVLYSALEQRPDVMVPTAGLQGVVGKLLGQENTVIWQGLKDKTRQRALTGLEGELANKPMVPFSEYWANVKRIGEKVGAQQASGGEALGATKLLYREAMKDLEQASAHYPELRAANDAFKKELAADTLHQVIQTQGINRRPDGLIQLQPQALRKWLANPANEDTVRNLSKDDLAGIHEVLTKVEALPRVPPPAGAMAGSFRLGTRAGIGGMIGGAITGSPLGASMGAAGGVVASDLVSRALMTDIGRKVLMQVLDRGPFLDHSAVAALAVGINAAARAKAQTPSDEQAPPLAAGTRLKLSSPLARGEDTAVP